MRRVLPFFAICVVLAGCMTNRRMTSVPAPLEEVRWRDLESTLESGDFLRALQHIEYLSSSKGGEISAEELREFREQALADLVASAEDAREAGEPYEAYRLYLSLITLNEQQRMPGWKLAEIVVDIIAARLQEKDGLSALIYLSRALDELEIDGDDLQSLEDGIVDLGLAKSLDVLLNRTEATGATTGDMLQGTATIWVDKGIRVEGGVGYPDRAMGSGFFVDQRGYLLTNYHVVQSEVDPEYEGYSRLFIRLPGRVDERIPAKVVGWDTVFDLALLKAEIRPDFVFSVIGQAPVAPGQRVLAIGSPVDPFLENTVTSGIVSAIGRRRFLQMGDVIQIDAAVNPGNSGGPLVNETGALLGIVFAGIKPFEGLSFAIPAHWVERVYPALAQGGKVLHPWLGMALAEGDHGLEVVYVVPGSPVAQAGLREGDRILSVGGQALNSVRDYQDYIVTLPIKTLVSVTFEREGLETSSIVLLEERPDSPVEQALKVDSRKNLLVPLFGMKIKEAGNFLWETEYVIERVLPGSAADNTGLSPGDALNLQNWRIDSESRYAVLQIFVKKRKAGYLERVIQLAAYLDLDSFV